MNQLKQILGKSAELLGADTVTGLTIRAVLSVLLALIAWVILRSLLGMVKNRLTKAEKFKVDDRIWLSVRRAVKYVLILVCGTYLIRLFDLTLIEKLFPALFIVLLAGPVTSFLLLLLGYLERKWADNTETKIDNIIFDLLNKFSGAVIYAVAVVLALDILGINVMPFVAGAGVLGIAVGFAAKDTLSNLIAGILLIIDRPFEMGDRIEVWSAPAGSATWGDVIDIGLRATKIKTTDNIIIVIPNNEIMKRDIVNYTLISTMIRVRINIGISYDSPIEKAKKVLLDIAATADWIAREPPPKVVVRSFGESSVDLQLRVWISDARKRMDTISYITDHTKTEFDAHGIEIPYPKRDIHMIQKIASS